MATVWRATDEHLGRQVALKILSDALAGDDSYVQRFRREARVAASLSHSRLVQVFDFGDEGGRPFLVMELIDGPTLAQVLRDERALELDEGELAVDLLDALAHVHAAGIVHRDIKPANVLMAPDGRARLTDFGVAQPPDATELTGTGLVIGTLRYLAPEVVAGHPATVRSDLFALGRLLREVTDAASGATGPQLTRLIEGLVREDPDERPASAREALTTIDASSRSLTLPAPTVRRPRPAAHIGAAALARRRALPRPSRLGAGAPGNRLLAPLAAVVALVAIVVAIALASATGGSGPPRPPAPSAPLPTQLDAIGRALDSTSR